MILSCRVRIYKESGRPNNHLQKNFVTKDLGPLRYFLGIEVARSKKGVVLSRRKCVLDLLHENGILGAKSASIPMDPKIHLYKKSTYLIDARRYRALVGKLLYVIITRPDISLAIGKISQFIERPTKPHWDAVMMVLRYRKSTPSRSLQFQREQFLDVLAYSDADYAGSSEDRKSTTGFCIFVGGNLVAWKSKKHKLYTDLVQNLSTEQWLKLQLSLCG